LHDLESSVFNEDVEGELSFLFDNGFYVPDDGRTSTSLTADVLFMDKHVAIFIALDRRAECINCHIGKVVDGVLQGNDVLGGYWGSLSAFLNKKRHYRESFSRFGSDEPETSKHLLD
jgi:hypothetical protein